LSGPMRGIEDENAPAFNAAAAKLRACGHEVYNPAEHEQEHDCFTAALAADLVWICKQADVLALLPGWEQSRGVAAEIATAVAIPLPVYFVTELCREEVEVEGWGAWPPEPGPRRT
jgi:hypothetical protein